MTTYFLDPCLSWLVKTGGEGIQDLLVYIINLSLDLDIYSERLKEAVVILPLKKPTLEPSTYHPVLDFCF